MTFCAYYVLTGNIKQASLQAGHNPWWGYGILKIPRIQRTVEEFERRKKEEAWGSATEQIRLTREFLDDEQFMVLLKNMKTHDRLGDLKNFQAPRNWS